MNRRFVQIMADDLTGALDAAAPFAGPETPMRLLLAGKTPAPSGRRISGLAVSSESRDLSEIDASTRVQQAFEQLDHAATGIDRSMLYFAKVDSVLRGHPIIETLQRQRLWDLRHCLFAPAFPEMGRRTVEARQEVETDDRWAAAAVHDLRFAFAQYGVEACLRCPGDNAPAFSRSNIVIGDAALSLDLSDHVAACEQTESMLWAGSRGLADALGGGTVPLPTPHISTMVIGTRHPLTRVQIDTARRENALAARRLIDPAMETATARHTHQTIAQALESLEPEHESGLFISGGDTLAGVCRALEVSSVLCHGEVMPGLPLAEIEGGPFDGLPLVTKSGGFGSRSLLVELLDSRQ